MEDRTNTMYKVYELEEAKAYQTNMGFLVILSDNNCLSPNLFVYHNEELMRKFSPNLFLLDHNDVHFMFPKVMEMKGQEELVSLGTFMNVCQSHVKKIYLRYLHFPLKPKILFLDEILDAIPLLLQQQNTPLPDDDTRIENIRERYSPSASVNEAALKWILEGFNINKELLTLVPDGSLLWFKEKSKSDAFSLPFFTDREGKDRCRAEDATLYLISTIVCGVNWSYDSCSANSGGDCLINFQHEVADVIYTWITTPEYKLRKTVLDQVELLRTRCEFKSQRAINPAGYFNTENGFLENVSGRVYEATCARYNLPMTTVIGVEHMYPMWFIRYCWITGWIKQFCGAYDPKIIYYFILQPFSEKAPENLWELYFQQSRMMDPTFFNVVYYQYPRGQEDGEHEEQGQIMPNRRNRRPPRKSRRTIRRRR